MTEAPSLYSRIWNAVWNGAGLCDDECRDITCNVIAALGDDDLSHDGSAQGAAAHMLEWHDDLTDPTVQALAAAHMQEAMDTCPHPDPAAVIRAGIRAYLDHIANPSN